MVSIASMIIRSSNQPRAVMVSATASTTVESPMGAFDADPATKWHSDAQYGTPWWIMGKLAAPRTFNTLDMTHQWLPEWNFNERNPRDFVVQGSNDGATFTDLFSAVGIVWTNNGSTGVSQRFQWSNATPYLYYRVYITAGNGDPYIVLAEVFYS